MATLYLLFKLLLLSDTRSPLGPCTSTARHMWGWDVVDASWGSPQPLWMGAAAQCSWPPFFGQTVRGTFCIMLRSGMIKPPALRPLKCSLPSVPPFPCFTRPACSLGPLCRTGSLSPGPGGSLSPGPGPCLQLRF